MARRANGTGTLYRRNGWYYGQLKVGDGIMRKALDTRDKREAIKRLDVLTKGFDLGDEERLAALAVHLKPKTGRHSFGEAWVAYLRAPENLAQSETARANNKTMWDGFMRWLHGQDIPRSRLNCKAAYPGTDCLDDISEKIAGEFVEWVKKNRSPETANKYVRVLKRVWNLNKASENPWASFRKFKVKSIQRRAFSKDEVDKIIDAADGELKVLFTIGAYTGMRMGDCQRLRYESIDESAGVIRTGKTGRIIRIPIHPVLKKALASKVRCGFVLKELSQLPEWKMSEIVQAHFEKLGFEKPEKVKGYKRSMGVVGFHSFRSTFITRLGEAGVPLPVVRDMVGHVSEEMTIRYFRRDDEMSRKAIAALN